MGGYMHVYKEISLFKTRLHPMDAERREVMLAHAAVLPLAGVATLGAVKWVVGRGVSPVRVCVK